MGTLTMYRSLACGIDVSGSGAVARRTQSETMPALGMVLAGPPHALTCCVEKRKSMMKVRRPWPPAAHAAICADRDAKC